MVGYGSNLGAGMGGLGAGMNAGLNAGLDANVHLNAGVHAGAGCGPCGHGAVGAGYGRPWYTTTGTILVLFILLVIITRTIL